MRAEKKPARWLASCTLSVKARSLGSSFSTDPNTSSIATLDSVAARLPMNIRAPGSRQCGQRWTPTR
ncbi:hypothetical protein [Halochromatium glycolicum]|uniref:hypothetical protein n=1 Tax=Halochromatium glycolicum TaxID=85075 RepID=UPI00190A56ED|nr:hypothetical protein [Halochromatium glycolicum]